MVNPPSANALFCTPPLGLVYLASALKAAGHDPKIVDLYSFNGTINNEDILASTVVCITGMSMQHNGIIQIAEQVKSLNPAIIVIVGGPHASALPKLLLQHDCIDYVLRGEADEQLPRLLSRLEDGCYRFITGLCCDPFDDAPPAIVKDVDSLPLPDWNLVDLSKYTGHYHGYFFQKEPVGKIYSSRGCPMRCRFCSRIIGGNKWRPHSPQRVLQEVNTLVYSFGVKEIHFEDDNFTLDRKRALQILSGMVGLDLSVGFPNGVRLDSLTDEVLEAIKEAGGYSVTCGIEFGSQEILDKYNKGLSLEQIERQINKIKSHGLYAQGFFIIGAPHETYEDVLKTIKFAKKLKLDSAFFGSYVPLPGSEDFDELLSTGRLRMEDIDWDTLFSVKAHDVSYHIEKDELIQLRQMAHRQFYFRPKIIMSTLSRIKNVTHLVDLLKRAGGLL